VVLMQTSCEWARGSHAWHGDSLYAGRSLCGDVAWLPVVFMPAILGDGRVGVLLWIKAGESRSNPLGTNRSC